MNKVLLNILTLVILCSCDGSSSDEVYSYQEENSFTTPPKKYNLDSIMMNGPDSLLYWALQPLPKKSFKQNRSYSYTLTGFWDEAEGVSSEAESILNEASSLNCVEAIDAAESAISSSEDCISTKNFKEAESYLNDAQSYLSDAMSYLDECQDIQKEDEEED